MLFASVLHCFVFLVVFLVSIANMRGTKYLVAALNIASGVLAYPSQTHSEQPIGADVPQAPAVAASLQDIATVGYATQNGGCVL